MLLNKLNIHSVTQLKSLGYTWFLGLSAGWPISGPPLNARDWNRDGNKKIKKITPNIVRHRADSRI